MQKKLLVFLLLTSSLSLQANYFARASRIFQAAKQQMINYWSKNKTSFNVNEFKGEMPKSVQSQRASSTALPTFQSCAQVQPTLLSRFNMFARRAVSQQDESGENSNQNQGKYDQESFQYKNILGAGIAGAVFIGFTEEYENPAMMIDILQQADEETKQKIIKDICTDPTWFTQKYSRYCVLKEIFKYWPDSIEPFIQSLNVVIESNSFSFKDFIQTPYGMSIVSVAFNRNPKTVSILLDHIFNNVGMLLSSSDGTEVLKFVIRSSSRDVVETIEQLILESHSQGFDYKQVIDAILISKFVLTLSENTTQTSRHFNQDNAIPGNEGKLKNTLNWCFSHHYSCHVKKRFSSMIEELLILEAQEQKAGRYSFVHGCPWQYHFLHDLYTELRSAKSGKKFDDYFFLRFINDMNSDSGSKHVSTRLRFMEHGVEGHYVHNNNQKYMLFMNYALFCNYLFSNTLHCIKNNQSEFGAKINAKKVFEHLGLDYSSYQEDIQQLQRVHQEANKFGAGLLLSFTPEMLKKSVYVCRGGGGKKMVEIDGVGKTDDVQLILDTLRNSPEKLKEIDHIEFVHVLTKDCALNPEVIKSGAVKIIPFNPADPEKLAIYKQKMAEFIAKVKADLAEQRMALNADELETWQDELLYFDIISKKYNCLNEDGCGSRLQEA